MAQVINNADQGGKFLARYLEKNMGVCVEEYTPQQSFSDGTLIPILPETLDLGATDAYYNQIEYLGQTGDDGNDTGDVPVVDFTINETRVPVYLLRKAVKYRYVDIQRGALAQKNGFDRVNIIDRATSSAIRAISLDANRIAAFGRRGGTSTGLLNDTNSPAVLDTFNPYTSGNADDVYDFITRQLTNIFENQEIEDDLTDGYSPNIFVLPSGMRRVLRNLKFAGTSESLENQIMKDYPSINVIKYTGLAGGDKLAKFGVRVDNTLDRMAVYPSHPHVLSRMISEVVPLPPAWDGQSFTQVFMHAVTATSISYPGFVGVTEFPNGN